MSDGPLFRQDALAAQRQQSLGSIVLIRPMSFSMLASFGVFCAVLIVSFLVWGEYTKRAHVFGILVPDAGLLKITSPTQGVIVEQHVKEGDKVIAGQILYVINAENNLMQADGTALSAGVALDGLFNSRLLSLGNERSQQIALTTQIRGQLTANLNSIRTELTHLEQQIATQTERSGSSKDQLQRWQNLSDQKFASETAVQLHKDDLLEQSVKLQQLEQSKIRLQREEASLASELVQSAGRAAKEQEQLQRATSEIEQAKINGQSQRQVVISAPVSGLVTSVMAELGQTIGAQTLASIVPDGSMLQAHLYAPSRAVGFVEVGQTVRLRYAAYPHQKFGQYEGKVVAVARSPVASQELPSALANLGQQLAGEGVYRITVDLASQTASVFGKQQILQAGMQLEADILQDTRRIVEWMFESALTLKGRI